MSILHADSFSMYGPSTSIMLDGVYVQTGDISLVGDPDGVSPGRVLRIGGSGANDAYIRYVLNSTKTTVGMASRVYMPALPAADDYDICPHFFRNIGNSNILAIKMTNTGRLQARSTTTTGTLFGETSAPVITAGTWIHLETRVTQDAAAGTVEVRVNGVTRLTLTGLALGANPIAQVLLYGGEGTGGGSQTYYQKDFVIWDTSGSIHNDFLGQVSVYWQRPLSTITAGGWVPNTNAAVSDTVDKPRLANVLTSSGTLLTDTVVRISNTYYKFTSGSVDAGVPAGTSGSPWLVALGVDAAASLANLYAAIGNTGTPGTTYSTLLTPHLTVTAFGLTATTVAVIPTDGITTSMTFSETGGALSWMSTTAFLENIHDKIYITAGYTPAVKATGTITLTGLPVADETVTIDGQVYVFKAAAASALEVTIGATADETGTNLATKITANSSVVTAANASRVVTLTAISGGTSGNALTLAEAATNTTVSGATLSGGVNTVFPDAAEIRLEPLPDDVTSVKAVIPVVRATKIDGGDGSLQLSFGISDASYSAGPDTPMTTAFAYWGNNTAPFVSEVNPLTASEWAPGAFNTGARIKIKRTT